MYQDGGIEEDVIHKITGWLKWWSVSRVLCDCRMPMKLKRISIEWLWNSVWFMVQNVLRDVQTNVCGKNENHEIDEW